jgi:hypothetical protein
MRRAPNKENPGARRTAASLIVLVLVVVLVLEGVAALM